MNNTEQTAGTQQDPNFRMWINPELLQEAETLFAASGLTVADAVYVFLRQALYTGRLPFEPSPENTQYLKDKALGKFLAEVEKGWKSAEAGGWRTLDEVEARLGNTQK